MQFISFSACFLLEYIVILLEAGGHMDWIGLDLVSSNE